MTVDPLPPIVPPIQAVPVSQWAGQLRTVLAIFAGLGFGGGVIPKVLSLPPDQFNDFVTIIVAVITAVGGAFVSWWSAHEKAVAARHANAAVVSSAVASAQATAERTGGPATPVVVISAPTIADPSATAARPVLLSEIHSSADIVPLPT